MSEAASPRAILVDLDETIVDITSGIRDSWRSACVDLAGGVAGLDADHLFDAVLRFDASFWSDPSFDREARRDQRAAAARIVQAALSSLGHDRPDLARAIAHAYRDRRERAMRPFPGAIDALADLRARGIRLALLTNGAGPSQRAKIERFHLTRYFRYILIEGEFGVGKPDERVYHAAMRALGAQPSETWMVGDNLEWEVVAPRRLGLGAVWVDRRGAGLPPDFPFAPTHVIAALHQLPGLLPPS